MNRQLIHAQHGESIMETSDPSSRSRRQGRASGKSEPALEKWGAFCAYNVLKMVKVSHQELAAGLSDSWSRDKEGSWGRGAGCMYSTPPLMLTGFPGKKS